MIRDNLLDDSIWSAPLKYRFFWVYCEIVFTTETQDVRKNPQTIP